MLIVVQRANTAVERRSSVGARSTSGASRVIARRASCHVHARLSADMAASTANIPAIPPSAASTAIIAGTVAAPVTSPTIAASRKRWAPSSPALGTVWRTANNVLAPARIQASPGSAPASPATIMLPPPTTPASACGRRAQASSPRACPGSPRPIVSATERMSAIDSPAVRTSAIEIDTKAMKLWRPNSSGPRKRAAAIEIATV